ncbi:MAG: response regulator [candidate division Zixibacteria bacterium]|nr:response regulator [candidate division Zixibacteria bacterium]MBU1471144.1 response regulator [candidate division Zixibacteria bacterium]MBU2626660.1 response regulator [candidate division Zixibacteria bacterium]
MGKVLIVEDEKNLLELYRMELEEEGYSVATAESGEAALRVSEEFQPDLVVLDLKLGEEEGLRVLSDLKYQNRERPVILNTAYNHYKHDFSSWAADAYLIKSGDISELKSKIRELLAN